MSNCMLSRFFSRSVSPPPHKHHINCSIAMLNGYAPLWIKFNFFSSQKIKLYFHRMLMQLWIFDFQKHFISFPPFLCWICLPLYFALCLFFYDNQQFYPHWKLFFCATRNFSQIVNILEMPCARTDKPNDKH